MRVLRYFFLSLLILVTSGCMGVSTKPIYNPVSLQGFKDAVVGFTLQNSEGQTGIYCTGSFISETQILTADHCPRGALLHTLMEQVDEDDDSAGLLIQIQVAGADLAGFKMTYETESSLPLIGQTATDNYTAKVVYSDSKRDLALIETTNKLPYHKHLEMSKTDPMIGEQVIMLGHPRAISWSLAWGRVSNVRTSLAYTTKKGPFLQLDVPTWGGNSGGPILNLDGEVIGVADFVVNGVSDYGFAVHRQSIHNFFLEYKAAQVEKAKKLEQFKASHH